MSSHSHSTRRGGRARTVALAVTGAATVGALAVTGLGVASAAPLPPLPAIPGLQLLPGAPGTTEVNEDLLPFVQSDTRLPGTVEVNEDFGAPAGGGAGSLRLDTPDSVAKATAFVQATSPLADWVDVAAYSAFRSADSTGATFQFPSLQLVIDFNGAAEGGFSTLTYEPVYNDEFDASLESGQWNRYEAGSQGWCSTRAIPDVFTEAQRQCSNEGVLLLEDISEALPDAVVTAFGINQGSGNPGVSSAVDLVTTPGTTYDFEIAGPIIVVPEPPVPGDGGGHGGDGHGGGKDWHGGDDGKGHDDKDRHDGEDGHGSKDGYGDK